MATVASPRPRSLACGAHHRIVNGNTGYDQGPGHWCYNAYEMLTGRVIRQGPVGSGVLERPYTAGGGGVPPPPRSPSPPLPLSSNV